MKITRFLCKTLIYLILILFAIITVFPFLYSFFGAFKGTQELMTSTSLLPKQFTLENYKFAFSNVNFAQNMSNSLIIGVTVVTLAIFTSTMSAYVFSRRNFKGKKLLKSLYIWSMFIAMGPATLYPTYQMVVNMGLNRSLIGIILIQIGAQVTNILLAEGYLNGITKEFDEAAMIDGCSFFGIYLKIIAPMILPIVAVIGLLVFRGSWNDYLMPMILTTGVPDLMPLTVAIVDLKGSGGMATMWSVMLAASNLSILPIIVVYIFCNKYFIQGITLGGVKG